MQPLSLRERQVANCVFLGWSRPRIAAALGICVDTVRNHLDSIYTKTGRGSAEELFAFLWQNPRYLDIAENRSTAGTRR